MRVANEWTLLDSKTDEMKFCHAENQREAIIQALEWGIIPRQTEDVRPRTGDATLMTQQEFQNFMDQHTK